MLAVYAELPAIDKHKHIAWKGGNMDECIYIIYNYVT